MSQITRKKQVMGNTYAPYSHLIFVGASFPDQVQVQVQCNEANPGQGTPVCRDPHREKHQGQITAQLAATQHPSAASCSNTHVPEYDGVCACVPRFDK